VKSELADRFDSVGEATRELFDYIEVFYNHGAVIRRSAKSVRPPSNDVHRRHSDDRGALGGNSDSDTMLDGYATERPSAFFNR
jgi:hypothetical protein